MGLPSGQVHILYTHPHTHAQNTFLNAPRCPNFFNSKNAGEYEKYGVWPTPTKLDQPAKPMLIKAFTNTNKSIDFQCMCF